jgi:3-methyladenine DNA glycosylase AlkD
LLKEAPVDEKHIINKLLNWKMTAKEILTNLKLLGKENYKSIIIKHGIPEPLYGVSIAELKKIEKRVKKDHRLSLQLYDSGIYEARYLAGLIADESKMTRQEIEHWAKTANCTALSQYTVAWVAAESKYGFDLAKKWIESSDDKMSTAGWATLSSIVAIKEDSELDLPYLKKLLDKIKKTIHSAPNYTRYAMNGFIIAAGSYVKELTEHSLSIAKAIGTVNVFMGATACKVPATSEYILKVQKKGIVGKKRKMAKC